jgi:hypothetical protein
MLTRLGESEEDAFTIMRIAGHSSIVVSQPCIRPTPEAVELSTVCDYLAMWLSWIQKRLPATVSATLRPTKAVSH